jgi:outer membrane receptor protein involved in Fe transport
MRLTAAIVAATLLAGAPIHAEEAFLTLTRSAYPREDLPSSEDVVTPDAFAAFDAQNAGDTLAHEASVQTLPIGHLGSLETARIRGATSNQTLLLIDGRPVGGAAIGTQDLSEIPTEQIDHVEIVRGGVSALYGPNAMGGVINVITKRALTQPTGEAGFEVGSYGREAYRANFGSRVGPLDYFIFGDQQYESGFRDNSDARDHNVGGNAGLSMGAGGKLLFDVSSYHSNAGIPGELYPDIPVNQYNNSIEKQAADPTARQVTDTNYLRTGYILPLPMNALMTVHAFGSQREADYADPDNFVDSNRHEQSKGGDAQFDLPHGLSIGGNFVHDREDSSDLITPSNTFIRSVENWGLFAEETFHIDRFTLIPSGRFDRNSQFGDAKNPRVQLIADALSWLRFSGSAARSFRAPTIDDLYYPFTQYGFYSYQGNPNLQPERAWTYDAGFEIHPDSFSFRATYFRSNVTDLIQTTTDLASTTVNIGTARRQGVEIQIDHAFNDYFRDEWNYTYLENVGIPVGYTDFVTLPYSPKHTVNYLATVTPVRGVTMNSTVRYLDASYSDNDQTGTKLGSRVIWDLRLAYDWRRLQTYIGVKDVTNRRYEEQAGYPLPGRTFFGGVTVKFLGAKS